MFTEEREPLLPEEEDPPETGFPPAELRGACAPEAFAVPGSGVEESSVWSVSICQSKEDPHFEHAELSSAFSVRQWGQIMKRACTFLERMRFRDYDPALLLLQASPGQSCCSRNRDAVWIRVARGWHFSVG